MDFDLKNLIIYLGVFNSRDKIHQKKFNFLIFGEGYFTNFTVIFLERYLIRWSHPIPLKFRKYDKKGKGIKYKILLIKKNY